MCWFIHYFDLSSNTIVCPPLRRGGEVFGVYVLPPSPEGEFFEPLAFFANPFICVYGYSILNHPVGIASAFPIIRLAHLLPSKHVEILYASWFPLQGAEGACYSVLKLFTGLAIAAFIAWKLTVIKVITIAPSAAAPKIHQDITERY